jgi:hypothetical protein
MADQTEPNWDHTRTAERVALAVPVDMRGTPGVTRDMSTSGVYFTCEQPLPEGSRISLTLMLDENSTHGPLKFHCHGEVVRVEPSGGQVGIAVRIEEYSILT